MKKQSTRRRVEPIRTPRRADPHRRSPSSLAEVTRLFDRIYTQLDAQLTRMAEIQLQFDALRSKIRVL